MSPDEIAAKISGLLRAGFVYFDPACEPIDGIAGNLVFCANESGKVFFIPLAVGKRIANYLGVVEQWCDAINEQEQAADKLISAQAESIDTLKLQSELGELDRIDAEVRNGNGPEIDLSEFVVGPSDE